MIAFKNYKHNYNQNPFSIILAKQLNACPVTGGPDVEYD